MRLCFFQISKYVNSRNLSEIGFPEVLPKKYIKKIHFLILPKQNTFTKPEKLKNCVNTAITKTKSIFILFCLIKNENKMRLYLIWDLILRIRKKQKENYGKTGNFNAKSHRYRIDLYIRWWFLFEKSRASRSWAAVPEIFSVSIYNSKYIHKYNT